MGEEKKECQVAYTQYMMPGGRQVSRTFVAASAVAAKAERLCEAGARLEAEVLRTGEVSVTVFFGGEDVAIEVVPNGPEVLSAWEQVIDNGLLAIANAT